MRTIVCSIAVLLAMTTLWSRGLTQHEKRVVSDSARAARLAELEATYVACPRDASFVQELSQSYLDAGQAGMAVTLLERADADVLADPAVAHVYARALVAEGRKTDALDVERIVVAKLTRPIAIATTIQ